MHVRAVIIARGDVQRVGYRDVVERAARKLKLTGFVENVKPYDVRIVCEGARSAIDSFVELIRIKDFPITVEALDVSFEPATGDYEYFEIKRGDIAEELGERLDLARTDMTRMIEKQDVMIQRQDVMIEKQDVMSEKQEETILVIKEEGEKTRGVLKGTLEEEIAWVKDEISEMKGTLNRVKQKVGVD
jgi:acylphosphatase